MAAALKVKIRQSQLQICQAVGARKKNPKSFKPSSYSSSYVLTLSCNIKQGSELNESCPAIFKD